MRVSIVINNYNYARFLGCAIESILGQSYKNIELIVVDDGSTDDSKNVIARYEGRLTAILKENGGQGSCYNNGFNVSTGDLVCFLDADDFLYPSAVQRVVDVWTPLLSKVQFCLAVVDEAGNPTGDKLPTADATGRDYLKLARRFGTYITPPSSGNFFSRKMLTEILPMAPKDWIYAADSVPILSAPFHGNIVHLEEKLGAYRRHGAGHSEIVLSQVGSENYWRKLSQGFNADIHRHNHVFRRYVPGVNFRPGNLRYSSPNLLKFRLAFLMERKPCYGDKAEARSLVLCDLFRSLYYWDPFTWKQKTLFVTWALLVAFVRPLSLARTIFVLGISQRSRTRWLRYFF